MTGIRRTAAAAAALLLALPLSIAAAAPALAASAATAAASASTNAPVTVPVGLHVDLPRPTGPYAVGRQILHLVDQNRPDPWVPSAGPRQLMVSMYYPAEAGTGGPAPYMTPEAARLMLDGKLPATPSPPRWSPAPGRGRSPTPARSTAGFRWCCSPPVSPFRAPN